MGMFSPSNPIQPKMIGTPIWAKREAGFMDVAFEVAFQNPRIVVVEYKNLAEGREFSRLYIVGPDGTPPPFMQGIWMELRKRYSGESNFGYKYEIDAEGRITTGGTLARANELWSIMEQMVAIYRSWLAYPTIGDFNTVEKLHKAQEAIHNFKEEEENKWIETQIGECRAAIKEHQNSISKYEKELNQIYERAADAMNLFEANGLKPDMRGYEKEKTPPPDDLDNAQQKGLRFVGEGKILLGANGEVNVFPSEAKSPTVGDLVHDTANSFVAVYVGNGKWELIYK